MAKALKQLTAEEIKEIKELLAPWKIEDKRKLADYDFGQLGLYISGWDYLCVCI